MEAIPMVEVVGTWIAALLTLFIFSFLYQDNRFYKFAEYLFVGSSAGFFFAITWENNFVQYVFQPFTDGVKGVMGGAGLISQLPNLLVVVPAVIGLLMIFMITENYAWLSRYPICILVGYGSGFGIIAAIKTNIIPQLHGTMLPLAGVPLYMMVQNLVIILCVLTGILYFFFSVEHSGLILGTGSRIGIFILMITFGAQFGTTIMGRIQLLIARMDFLIYDWLGKMILGW